MTNSEANVTSKSSGSKLLVIWASSREASASALAAWQRTPGFGVQLPSAALVRPAQSRAVLPAMKPGTARAFASRRFGHTGAFRAAVAELGVVRRFHAFTSMNIPNTFKKEFLCELVGRDVELQWTWLW